MLKILHIIPTLRKGGAERLVLDICNEFSRRKDAELLLVTLYPENDYAYLSEGIAHRYCPARVVPSMSGQPIVNIKPFADIVNEFRPDIIHSHLFEAEMISRWQLTKNVLYVTHCHFNMPQFDNFSVGKLLKKSGITNLYEKRLILNRYRKCNNRFIAISKHTETYFKSVLPSSLLPNISCVPNAINTGAFETDRPPFQKKDHINLISTGSLQPRKNHIFLADVVLELKKRGRDVRLDIIGEGPEREKIENRINAMGLGEQIRMPGMKDDMREAYSQADLYIHAAIYEPFGLVMLEAMASGLPVICLDGKGNRDVIEDGKNGFMIDEQQASLFADRIIEITDDPSLYDHISAYAHAFAKDFDIKAYCERLMQFYLQHTPKA